MIIYLATNKLNGKQYVGLTSQKLQTRKREHKCRVLQGDKTKFYNAIRLHGWEAFKWEEIDNAMFYDDLKEKEKYWIRKLNTYRKGYNSTIGGDGLIGVNAPKGEKNPYSVLTEKQAQEIIDLLRAGEIMLEEIAERYNVSMSTIGAINTGRNWSHLYKGDCPSKAGRKRIQNQRGEKIGHAKVTSEQVIEVKRLLAAGLSRKKVAEQLNIALSTVDNIKGGYSWGWLKTPFDEKITTNPRSKLTEVEVKEIKQLLKQGVMQKVIAERFNIAKTVISRISTGDIWKDSELSEYLENNEKVEQEKMSNAKKVKELLLKGLEPKQIADTLNISENFVANIINGNHFSYVGVEGWDEYRAKRKAWNEKYIYQEKRFLIFWN